jgi:hypothetical protein
VGSKLGIIKIFQTPVIFSGLGPNILLSILYSDSLEIYVSLNLENKLVIIIYNQAFSKQRLNASNWGISVVT